MSGRTAKLTKWPMRVAKTQISLGIRLVRSESSLSAWIKLGCWATHWAHSEDSGQAGRIPRLIWVSDGRTCHFVCFVELRLIYSSNGHFLSFKWSCFALTLTTTVFRSTTLSFWHVFPWSSINVMSKAWFRSKLSYCVHRHVQSMTMTSYSDDDCSHMKRVFGETCILHQPRTAFKSRWNILWKKARHACIWCRESLESVSYIPTPDTKKKVEKLCENIKELFWKCQTIS